VDLRFVQAGTGGDVAAAEAEAEVVIKPRYIAAALIPSSMEPRSVIVDPSGGEWTMYSATQIPHVARFLLAATTGTPEHKIRVIAPDVGGGFGGKLAVTPEEWITFAVSTKVGRR
jgi:carbon-monoxide dehydrogenase large subunit